MRFSQLCLLAFVLLLFLFRNHRSSDYTVAMSQCQRIIAATEQYNLYYHTLPTENELMEFMERHALNPDRIIGWKFSGPEDTCFARKDRIKSGFRKTVSIVIRKDLEFFVERKN